MLEKYDCDCHSLRNWLEKEKPDKVKGGGWRIYVVNAVSRRTPILGLHFK